jgi:uncharacterized protein YrrD
MKRQTLTWALALLLASAPAAWADVKNLDYSVREVEIVGQGPTAEEALANAELMALQQAVLSLVQTEGEQQQYKRIEAKILEQRIKYVTRQKILGKGTTESGGRYYKLICKVNIALLRQDLEAAKVISSTQELTQQLRNPTIMAFYQDPSNTSTYAEWAVGRVNNYLVRHNCKAVDAAVMRSLRQDDQVVTQAAGQSTRLHQALALKAQADLYMSVTVDPKVAGRSGDYTYYETMVKVEAYEASSGQAFISKTYQRRDAQGNPEALAVRGSEDVSAKAVIEESVAGVMPQILEDLLLHWKRNVAQGSQFRIVVKGIKDAQAQELESVLRELTRGVTPQAKGDYLIRYSGVIGDLADELEERLQERLGLSLERFDLGSAYFVIQGK